MSKPDYKSFIDDTLFVLVLYKLELRQSKSFNSLLDQLKDSISTVTFLIYDNSPESLYDSKNYQFSNIKLHYIHDKNNSGVSKAYNEGFELAKKLNKKWILLLDQDTNLSKNLICDYYTSIIKYPEIHLFVPMLKQDDRILSPCRFVFNRGVSFAHFLPGLHAFNKISVLNSGMLISTESFSKVGGFNEKIKLDFADFYFINKYKKKYHSFVVTNTTCIHELSSNEKNVDNILVRFKYYCQGARIYSEDILKFSNLLLLVFYRTIKLTFIHKKVSFIKEFILYFLLGVKIN